MATGWCPLPAIWASCAIRLPSHADWRACRLEKEELKFQDNQQGDQEHR
jgi:hypothetical protein